MAKRGLGRGIGSLITDEYSSDMAESQNAQPTKEVVKEVIKEVTVNEPLQVKVRDIEPNRDQPRENFDEESLGELAESIKRYGIIQPLILKKTGKTYQIIAGERRWRAAKLAGLREVPAIVKEYTDQEITEVAIIENIQRENLNPVEEAKGYQRLTEVYGLKQEEIAGKVSKSRASVANSMRLLKLPENVLALLSEGQISTGHAKVLLGMDTAENMSAAAEKIVEDGLSVRQTEALVKKILAGEPKPKKELSNAELYSQIEEKLAGSLNSKVVLKRSTENKGKIEISYSSLEELEGIIGKIL